MPRKRSEPSTCLPVGDRIGIFLRGKTWYVNYQLNGRQVRSSLKTTSKKEATLRAQRIEAELDRGDVPAKCVTAGIPALAAAFLEFHETDGRASKTMSKYRRVMQEVLALASERRLTHVDQINATFADQFRTRLKKAGNSQKTIYNKSIILRSLSLFAFRRRLCATDPLAGYRLKKPRPTPQPCWKPSEADAILVASPQTYRPFFTFLRETGCRAGEAQFLTPADIDFQRRLIHIRPKGNWKPKTGDQRQVPMTKPLFDLLRTLPLKGPWVFRAPVTAAHPGADRQISLRRALLALKRVLRKLQLTGHLHTFRHTFVSQALMKGVPEAVVRTWVGHVDPEILRLYTHVADDVSQIFIERFSGPSMNDANTVDTARPAAE